MSSEEFNKLLGYHLAAIRAPRTNKTSRRVSKRMRKQADLQQGRYISIRGFAKI